MRALRDGGHVRAVRGGQGLRLTTRGGQRLVLAFGTALAFGIAFGIALSATSSAAAVSAAAPMSPAAHTISVNADTSQIAKATRINSP